MSNGINFFCKFGLWLPEVFRYFRALFMNTTFQRDNCQIRRVLVRSKIEISDRSRLSEM
ncbi:uncharacterized protein METZ01_LOCUS328360, partial [marine metagenome]